MTDHKPNSGYLELFLGPMFSGKTSRLIDIYKREEFCSQHPIVINYSGDNRYSDHETHMSSHDSIKIPCIRTTNLSDIFDVGLYLLMKSTRKDDSKFLENIIVSTPDDDNTLSSKINIIKSLIDEKHPTFTRTILINEGQFFPDVFDWVKHMVTYLNKRVYIAGLDGDFKQNPIGDLLKLLPYSNKCTKLTSLCYDCRDGTEAIFSHRITSETEQIVIGSDNYVPLCRYCYCKRNNISRNINTIINVSSC